MAKIIKVLIIDDSAVMRELLKSIITEDPRFEVVGVSSDPILAKSKIPRINPDVLTLDVEMPRMDGLTFLKELMEIRPMPVVMVSSHTEKGARETFRALELGAIDFITKPKMDASGSLDPFITDLCNKLEAAANAKIRSSVRLVNKQDANDRGSLDHLRSTAGPRKVTINPSISGNQKIIVIGASTGGTKAIQEIAEALPIDSPGIAVVQHMPPRFTGMYAKRINQLSALDIREAEDGDTLAPGTMLIANGAYHLAIAQNSRDDFIVNVFDGDLVNQHKPAVDILFESASHYPGADILGIILTGMGKDGAKGMLSMYRNGSYTIAQDKKSCVIYGMPDQANKLGAVNKILSISDIPSYIARWATGNISSNRAAS
ncbi:MAG: chemotaxis response regulator protein-glutamate methylesterase [Acidiferrobacterales bacterium]